MKNYLIFIFFLGIVGQTFSQKPNIMIVIADDVGIDAMGAYGIGIDVASTLFRSIKSTRDSFYQCMV